MAKNLLEAVQLNKHFGGVSALHNISFSIPESCIYGIIGPNGAGKTTLFNVITGLYTADSGTVLFRGKNIVNQPPHTIVKQGIARTFQNIRLFKSMTAMENVMVGRHTQSEATWVGAILRNRSTRIEEKTLRENAARLLDYVGIGSCANRIASELSYGDQRRLEIARALASEPKLLALDEPAAGMNPSETQQLQSLLQRILANGTSILLIEHDVKFVMNLCERVLVLDYGERIAEDTPAAIQQNPKVIEAYLGISP